MEWREKNQNRIARRMDKSFNFQLFLALIKKFLIQFSMVEAVKHFNLRPEPRFFQVLPNEQFCARG